jgi:hypothetical protein
MNDWTHFEERYGAEIGRGAQCRVYRSGDHAIKVLTEGHCLLDALRKSYALAVVEEAGIPLSNLEGVYKEAGHIVIETRYVAGDELMNVLSALMEQGNDDAITRHVEKMVAMQVQMHATEVEGLGSTHAFCRNYIQRCFGMGEPYRTQLLRLLDGLPDGDRLCHNDYHPRNILFDGKDHTVIDWDSATIGDPAGDVAHSYAVTLMSSKMLADAYLDRYLETTGMDPERVERWLPLHALELYDVLKDDGKPYKEALKPLFAQLG